MKDPALIVAGGRGKRFGGPVRKQYLKLKGRPLVWWSLEAFEKSPSIQSGVLVVPKDDLSSMKAFVKRQRLSKPFVVVAGGNERSDSVRRGLAVVRPSIRWIAVHDAVRPFVTPDLIEATLKNARRSGAALAAYPSKDTVKLTDDGRWVRTTQRRETVWLAQTPQCFARSLLDRAHRKFKTRRVTDDAQMVEMLGVKVRLVESPAENIKVTVPLDLILARNILTSPRRKPGSIMDSGFRRNDDKR